MREPPVDRDLFAGRYALGRVLKRGNGVDTIVAEDTRTGTEVVLKSIDAQVVHAAARLRFEHETRVLRQLSGSGLAELHDSGEADNRLYLVQPRVHGQTLESVLRSGRLSVDAVLRIGIDIARALSIAHDAGIVHRDVKPANVIIDGSDPVNAVTLIDFGFARSALLDESVREDLVGTVRYLAPEAAGLLSATPDERSDLYAVGILLFECLAGTPPFPGPGVSDLLRQHLSTPAPAVCDIRPDVPRVLDAILQRLLRKDPVDRYQSAAALGADLAALRTAIAAGDPDPRLTIGRVDHRQHLTDPAFVGREAELASLQALLTEIGDGGSGLVLLDAESGGGKSRLLAELASQAVSLGITVLHGARGSATAYSSPSRWCRASPATWSTATTRDRCGRRCASGSETARRSPPTCWRRCARCSTSPTTTPAWRRSARTRSVRSAASRRSASSCPRSRRPRTRCCWCSTTASGPTLSPSGCSSRRSRRTPSCPRTWASSPRSAPRRSPTDAPLRSIATAKSLHLGQLSDSAMTLLAESMAGPVAREGGGDRDPAGRRQPVHGRRGAARAWSSAER